MTFAQMLQLYQLTKADNEQNETIVRQLDQIKKTLENLDIDRKNEIKILQNEINFYKQLFIKINECLPFMNEANFLEKILTHDMNLDILAADLKLALHRYTIENSHQFDYFNLLDSL